MDQHWTTGRAVDCMTNTRKGRSVSRGDYGTSRASLKIVELAVENVQRVLPTGLEPCPFKGLLYGCSRHLQYALRRYAIPSVNIRLALIGRR
jgi:hypothetical protein